MWSTVDVSQFLRLTLTDTLYVEVQDVLKPWPHGIEQCLPVSMSKSNEESSIATAERLIFPCQESLPIYEARYQAVELAMKNVGRKLDEIFFF